MATVAENLNELTKTEDVAHVSGDKGFQLLAVRNDTLAALAGTDGDYAPIQVDANGGLYVSAAAGTNNIGLVSTSGVTITQTPTVTAGAYSAGDNVGGLLTFASAAQVTGGGGVIKDVLIVDDAGQDVVLELWLFDTTFTAGADNAAWAPTEAELHTLITVISTSDGTWIAGGTPSVCPIEVARRYDCTGTSLFGRLVTRGTPTFAATDDVTVRVMLLQD